MLARLVNAAYPAADPTAATPRRGVGGMAQQMVRHYTDQVRGRGGEGRVWSRCGGLIPSPPLSKPHFYPPPSDLNLNPTPPTLYPTLSSLPTPKPSQFKFASQLKTNYRKLSFLNCILPTPSTLNGNEAAATTASAGKAGKVNLGYFKDQLNGLGVIDYIGFVQRGGFVYAASYSQFVHDYYEHKGQTMLPRSLHRLVHKTHLIDDGADEVAIAKAYINTVWSEVIQSEHCDQPLDKELGYYVQFGGFVRGAGGARPPSSPDLSQSSHHPACTYSTTSKTTTTTVVIVIVRQSSSAFTHPPHTFTSRYNVYLRHQVVRVLDRICEREGRLERVRSGRGEREGKESGNRGRAGDCVLADYSLRSEPLNQQCWCWDLSLDRLQQCAADRFADEWICL